MALLSTSFRTEIAYLTSARSDFQRIRLVKANLDILIIRNVPLLDDVTIRNNRIIVRDVSFFSSFVSFFLIGRISFVLTTRDVSTCLLIDN